ncbi:MAG: hypothetical protein GY820_34490 [Gammaproteobacteria bacterium]|nr:hypothetical protein [Gammaproteobacteria bacterium]
MIDIKCHQFRKTLILADFRAKNRFFAFLTEETQAQCNGSKTTLNRFYGQKYVKESVSEVSGVSSRKCP